MITFAGLKLCVADYECTDYESLKYDIYDTVLKIYVLNLITAFKFKTNLPTIFKSVVLVFDDGDSRITFLTEEIRNIGD